MVGGAILRTGRCLAARRAAHVSNPLKWEFPGGKVETGETPEIALVREIREELALDIEVAEWLGRGTSLHTKDPNVTIVLDVYVAHSAIGEPRLSDHDQVRWLAKGEAKSLIWAAADIPILPALERRLEQDLPMA